MAQIGYNDFMFCVENDCYVAVPDGNIFRVCVRQSSKTGNFIEKYETILLKGSIDKNGYKTYRILVDGKKRHLKAHRIILNAFLGIQPQKQCNHKNGEKLDLTGVFTQFDIYEDIFSHFLTGMLSLRDTSDMLKNFPVIGGEEVVIAFSDSEYNSGRFFDFYVDEVMPQPVVSDETNKNTFLTFKLASADNINALKTRFSYRFKDMTQTIFNTLLTEMNSKKNVTMKDSIQQEFVANFWNIDEIIDYLSYQNKDSLFFETSDQYRFESLNRLVSQSPVQELFMLKNLEGKTGLNIVQQYHFDKFWPTILIVNIES
jgi:hypothetical protein